MSSSFDRGAAQGPAREGRVAPPRERVALACLVGLHAGLLAAMAARGEFAFLWKTAVVPGLVLAALLTGRGARFIADWSGYLSLLVLYDCLRGLVFALVTRYELPTYMGYAIGAERLLGAGEVFPVVLQRSWGGGAQTPVLDAVFVLVHASHFFAFLLFGFAVWTLRPGAFARHATGMLALMYAGALLYLLVPTVPPWMAAERFGVLPHLRHVSAELYAATVPTLQRSFDVNPIAAMPSLHAAIPTMCALTGFQHFRWRAWPVGLYAVLVFVGSVYLGEHYLVDVLAGIALAAALHWLVSARGRVPRALGALLGASGAPPNRRRLLRIAAVALLVVAGAEGIGRLTLAAGRPYRPTPAFIRRELGGDPAAAARLMIEYVASRPAPDRAR